MKAMLLATAMIAAPVLAQTATNTAPATDTTAPAAEQSMPAATETMPAPAQPATTTAPATDTNMTAPAQDAPMTTTTTTTTSTAPMPRTGGSLGPGQTLDNDPPGYQPAAAPTAPAAGATVTFQASADPATAYPPPAPQATYPICKKGQYDNCMERSTASGARHPSQPK